MRKVIKAAVLVPIVFVLTAGAALALNQTSGQGLTAEGNSLGFNAKSDLSGHLTYVTHDGSGLVVFCSGYDSYREATTATGYPRVRVTATCTDQLGATIYLKAYFIDKGEPGSSDKVLLYLSYNEEFKHNAELDPNAITDVGVIQEGNVQILNSGNTAQMANS
jgi:hypothetical protein